MNRAESGGVVDEQEGRIADALVGLRSRLQDAVARAGLSRDQLVSKTELSRTTLHHALRDGGHVPSAQTVATLAKQLELPVQELLRLRRLAVGEPRSDDASAGPGKPIGQFDPHALEVHPAGPRELGLPRYVWRDHDDVLEGTVSQAAEGRSGLLMLVGTSSTGKTRACWEAIQPLKEQGWQLWHPFDPTRSEAALAALGQVGPYTVVWLNEAQHYLSAGSGERIAAALHTLLTDPERGPVLVLGTLWPEYADAYTTVPRPGQPDPHTRVRELLAGRLAAVPAGFDDAAVAQAEAFAAAGDKLLAQAVSNARDGRLPQILAGAPQLLQRQASASPGARAVLDAAMDARRLGIGLHLSMGFLSEAAEDYLRDDDFDRLSDNWFEQALAELGTPVHGDLAPLRRVRRRRIDRLVEDANRFGDLPPEGPAYRLADYLEQHGRETRRRLCPPASFWEATHRNIVSPDDLAQVAQAAYSRHRTQWAHRLRNKAALAGDVGAMTWLFAEYEKTGDQQAADALLQRAAASGDPDVLNWLSRRREEAGDHDRAVRLAVEAGKAGDTQALVWLGHRRRRAGDRPGAEALYRQAWGFGDIHCLRHLAGLSEEAGDHDGADLLAAKAAAVGDSRAVAWLADVRERAQPVEDTEEIRRTEPEPTTSDRVLWLVKAKARAGNHEAAQRLAVEAADRGDMQALRWLAQWMDDWSDHQLAEPLYERAAEAGDGQASWWLGHRREESGDDRQAESLYLRAAQADVPDALHDLARMREEAGDPGQAEQLACQAAEATEESARSSRLRMYHHPSPRHQLGTALHADALYDEAVAYRPNTRTLLWLARRRYRAGDHDRAEHLARHAAEYGNVTVWFWLARLQEEATAYAEAERLLREVGEQPDIDMTPWLVRLKEKSGEREHAEQLALGNLVAGRHDALQWLAGRRDDSNDFETADCLVLRAAEAGLPGPLQDLVLRRGAMGKLQEAERLALRAADAGGLLYRLASTIRHKYDGDIRALLERAAELGSIKALCDLAIAEEKAGNYERAERLALQAAEAGNTRGLEDLAKSREVAGDRRGAELCALKAADAGNSAVVVWLSRRRRDTTADQAERLWPYGLNPDGTPTAPW